MKNQSQLQTRADPGRSVLLTGGFLLEERVEIGSMRLSKDPSRSLWWIFRALHDGCDPTPPQKNDRQRYNASTHEWKDDTGLVSSLLG